jgi:ferric-dicitrate binding protein FerR (iron transport regulator)
MSLALSVAAGAAAPRMATVYDAKPVARVLSAGAAAGETLYTGQPLYLGQKITVDPSGRAGLVLADGSVLRLEGGSELTLAQPASGLGTLLKLAKGLLRLNAEKQNGRQLLLETSNAVAAVKGTQYQVNADAARTEVQVLEGQVELKPAAGGAGVMIGAQQAAVSYPDRVDAVRKLNFEEVKALRTAFKELVEQKKKEYAKRVRDVKGKRSTPKQEGK